MNPCSLISNADRGSCALRDEWISVRLIPSK